MRMLNDDVLISSRSRGGGGCRKAKHEACLTIRFCLSRRNITTPDRSVGRLFVVAVVPLCPSTVALVAETPRPLSAETLGKPPRRPRGDRAGGGRRACRSAPIELLDVGSILLCLVAASCCLVTAAPLVDVAFLSVVSC